MVCRQLLVFVGLQKHHPVSAFIFTWLLPVCVSVSKFYHLLICSKEGRKKDKKRNTDVREKHCMCHELGPEPANPGMCPDQESNQ